MLVMKKSNIEVFKLFNQKKVKYLLVGVYAIDHYIKDSSAGFHTLDCDILVEPAPKNLLIALQILEELGYQLEANKEPIVGIDLWLAKRTIERQAVTNAKKENEMPLDIMINAGRIPYQKWSERKKIFAVQDVRIPVGSLTDLIRAKENSNREKDRKFLALYKIQLKEMLKKEEKS